MDPRCEETRALAAELALGAVEGEERGRALQHLAECPACRGAVGKLSDVADELPLLAPSREPPPGFESRVLAEVPPRGGRQRRRRGLWRVLAPAAAAAAAVAITLAVVSDDLRLASDYREALDAANGREFDAYPIRAAGGEDVGRVFAYDGSPSWLMMTVEKGYRAGMKGADLVMDDGRRIPIRWFYMSPEWGTCGGEIRVDLEHVSVLRIVPRRDRAPLVARFGAPAEAAD